MINFEIDTFEDDGGYVPPLPDDESYEETCDDPTCHTCGYEPCHECE